MYLREGITEVEFSNFISVPSFYHITGVMDMSQGKQVKTSPSQNVPKSKRPHFWSKRPQFWSKRPQSKFGTFWSFRGRFDQRWGRFDQKWGRFVQLNFKRYDCKPSQAN